MESSQDRKKRKSEARNVKKQRIEAAGGVRPRERAQQAPKPASSSKNNNNRSERSWSMNKQRIDHNAPRHRFGRVMDRVPSRNQPRLSTLSIAIPGSVVANCQTRELQTHLVGQIARAATIYGVDEIVVFDDKMSKNTNQYANSHSVEAAGTGEEKISRSKDPHQFMARVLQYCECPQYLRRKFFPMHPDLQFAGLLPPLDAPHHVRAEDRSKYREGVVLEKTGPNGGSLVYCGIRNKHVEIDKTLNPDIRCTIKLEPDAYNGTGTIQGVVVSPSAPREDNGAYWGYTTRLADSMKAVFDEGVYGGKYDLKIGTSERGTTNVDSPTYSVPPFHHALVVFGGVAGIEECIDADEGLKLSGSMSHTMFDQWINVCPFQSSRTIRTEEAVLITLAKLSSPLEAQAHRSPATISTNVSTKALSQSVEFTDDEPSDESSDGDD